MFGEAEHWSSHLVDLNHGFFAWQQTGFIPEGPVRGFLDKKFASIHADLAVGTPHEAF